MKTLKKIDYMKNKKNKKKCINNKCICSEGNRICSNGIDTYHQYNMKYSNNCLFCDTTSSCSHPYRCGCMIYKYNFYYIDNKIKKAFDHTFQVNTIIFILIVIVFLLCLYD